MPWPLPAGGSGGSEGCGALRQILGFAAETSRVRGREYHNISVLEQCIGVTCRRPGPFHVAPGVRESPSPPGRGVWGEGRVGIGLPVAKFLDISPSPPAPLPGGEGREPANPLPSQREMALCRRPTAGRNRFIRTNAVRLDGIAVVSDQDRIHAGRRHLFIGFRVRTVPNGRSRCLRGSAARGGPAARKSAYQCRANQHPATPAQADNTTTLRPFAKFRSASAKAVKFLNSRDLSTVSPSSTLANVGIACRMSQQAMHNGGGASSTRPCLLFRVMRSMAWNHTVSSHGRCGREHVCVVNRDEWMAGGGSVTGPAFMLSSTSQMPSTGDSVSGAGANRKSSASRSATSTFSRRIVPTS